MASQTEGGPRRRSGAAPWIALALTCVVLAVIDRTLVRDALRTLGAVHREVVEADAASTLSDLPGAEPRSQRLRLRRTDEVLVTSGEVAVIQSTLSWSEPGGSAPLAQTTGLYGVQRLTREHAAGYGDEQRHGQFQPRPGLERGRLTLWDSFHGGPLELDFEAVEVVDGIPLWRYRLAAEPAPIDASATYGRLPLVPERFQVRAQVLQASLLLEPRTGRVVDRDLRGHAWYVTADDPTPLGDAHRWSWRYSAEDRARLIGQVRDALRVLEWVEFGLPLLMLTLAGVALALAWRRRPRPTQA